MQTDRKYCLGKQCKCSGENRTINNVWIRSFRRWQTSGKRAVFETIDLFRGGNFRRIHNTHYSNGGCYELKFLTFAAASVGFLFAAGKGRADDVV